jgi:4-nitrophenyl phosphatase
MKKGKSMTLSNVKALILDMDGVLWRGNEAIGDLSAIFKQLDQKGIQTAFATNNSTRTVQQYIDRLHKFDIPAESWQVITSGTATAEYLSSRWPQGGRIYVIGEDGIRGALEEKGFTFAEQDVTAVVIGMDNYLQFESLRKATLLIRSGAHFIGTNPDRTFPVPEGLTPGTGAILAAVEAATDIKPKIIGKPSPLMFQSAMQRMGTEPQETLVVGDRLETDIAGGQAAGCLTAFVLTGVSSEQAGRAWQPAIDLISINLASVIERI